MQYLKTQLQTECSHSIRHLLLLLSLCIYSDSMCLLLLLHHHRIILSGLDPFFCNIIPSSDSNKIPLSAGVNRREHSRSRTILQKHLLHFLYILPVVAAAHKCNTTRRWILLDPARQIPIYSHFSLPAKNTTTPSTKEPFSHSVHFASSDYHQNNPRRIKVLGGSHSVSSFNSLSHVNRSLVRKTKYPAMETFLCSSSPPAVATASLPLCVHIIIIILSLQSQSQCVLLHRANGVVFGWVPKQRTFSNEPGINTHTNAISHSAPVFTLHYFCCPTSSYAHTTQRVRPGN